MGRSGGLHACLFAVCWCECSYGIYKYNQKSLRSPVTTHVSQTAGNVSSFMRCSFAFTCPSQDGAWSIKMRTPMRSAMRYTSPCGNRMLGSACWPGPEFPEILWEIRHSAAFCLSGNFQGNLALRRAYRGRNFLRSAAQPPSAGSPTGPCCTCIRM